MKCDLCGGTIMHGECIECGKKFNENQKGENKSISKESSEAMTGRNMRGYSMQKNQDFYKTVWFCIFMLILCAPAGIILMWSYGHFTKPVRVIITVLLGISIIGSIMGGV